MRYINRHFTYLLTYSVIASDVHLDQLRQQAHPQQGGYECLFKAAVIRSMIGNAHPKVWMCKWQVHVHSAPITLLRHIVLLGLTRCQSISTLCQKTGSFCNWLKLCSSSTDFDAFYRAACSALSRRGLAMRKLSVCLSARLSNACIVTKRKKDLSRFLYCTNYERSFSLVFWEEERLAGATPSTWNFGSTGPRWNEIAYFRPIFARSASAITPSEKSSNTLIGSPLRAFQWA